MIMKTKLTAPDTIRKIGIRLSIEHSFLSTLPTMAKDHTINQNLRNKPPQCFIPSLILSHFDEEGDAFVNSIVTVTYLKSVHGVNKKSSNSKSRRHTL